MSFFKNLFGKSDNKSSDEIRPLKSSIFEYFTIDLFSIPNENFKLIGSENTDEGLIKKYSCVLANKECNLFNEIEVIESVNHKVRNIFFKAEINNIKQTDFKNLLNDLYLTFGKDDNKKAGYSNQDWSNLMSGFFDRTFFDNSKTKLNPVMLDKSNSVLGLGIWRIGASN